MKGKTWRYLELVFIVCIISILIGITSYLSTNNIFAPDAEGKRYVNDVSLSIVSPYWNLSYHTQNTSNISAATFLIEVTQYYNITVEKEYWPGYDSFFITTLGNLTNGMNDRYWQYYVNDIYADTGCRVY